MPMHTATALRLARSLLDQHGLRDWTLALDRAKTRAGATHFRTRRITLSGPLTRAHDEDLVRDTILHEIAHALVGPAHGHDSVWKAKAREVGATDERCFSSEAARELAPFVGTCPAGHEVSRHRRPTRLVACAQCSSSFDTAHLFAWTYRGRAFTEHPDYVRAMAGSGASSGRSARSPAEQGPRLQLGTAARIVAEGRFRGRTGEIEAVGRTRYQVRVDEGVLSVPFELVEPA
jgi:predicted SprT family Zn-dependent metalloprotease